MSRLTASMIVLFHVCVATTSLCTLSHAEETSKAAMLANASSRLRRHVNVVCHGTGETGHTKHAHASVHCTTDRATQPIHRPLFKKKTTVPFHAGFMQRLQHASLWDP